MKRKWIFVLGPIALVVFVGIIGEIVMHLWNWLLPMLFGWKPVTFWEALGLLVLCRILFGGFGGHNHGKRERAQKRLRERWESLPPEERERLSQGWPERCGGFKMPSASATEATKYPS
ncbi:MAG: hypothetical protein ABR976_21090 [Terracidiphilus sp.]|jgi:hypothetical protein